MLYIRPHTPLPHSDTRQIRYFFAPRLRYAFTFSPYRYGSFPLTIPHSIKSAALPVTNGVAKDVPVNAAYPPPTVVVITSTPGATRSGFTIFVSLVNPLPEKSAYANVLASYAPTDIARLAEDGIVSVVASVGNKNPVPRFNTLSLGSHISYCPVTIFPALRTILHIPSVR